MLDPASKLALSRQLSCGTATSTLGEELGLKEKIFDLLDQNFGHRPC